jgi:hypothetical protein
VGNAIPAESVCAAKKKSIHREEEMTKLLLVLIVCGIATLATGCSTTGHFTMPEGSKLYVDNRPEPVPIDSAGVAKMRPFFWTSASGIRYRLEKDGVIVKQGKLRSEFRPVSIFWPPYAMIYWPMGLKPRIQYDLINDIQEEKTSSDSNASLNK